MAVHKHALFYHRDIVCTQPQLRRWGFSDPSAVTVFGYGGAMLPETFSENDIDDLNQLPVIRTDSKILFYAQGPTSWSYNEKTKEYDHEQNTYSTAGYYFLTDSKNQSATIAEREGGQTTGLQDITSFDEHAVYEQELYSPGSTGRLFLGDDFRYTTSKSFTFELPGVDNSSPVKLRTSFGAKILGGTATLVFTRNGQTLPSSNTDNIGAGSSSSYDFVRMTSTLKEIQLPAKSCYNLQGYSATTHIWDISDPLNPVSIKPNVNNGNARFVPTKGNEEYIAFDEQATVASVEFIEKVPNQNLHGLTTPDMVILTPKEYISYGTRRAPQPIDD